MHTAVQTQIQVIKMHKDFPIADLKPFPRNPRHNQSAIDAVEKSLTAFGAIAPIVADENGRIAAGHTRYEAAIRAGLSTFPVIICKFPDENSFVGYNITDNQTASIADWDDTELAKLLVELGEDDFDVSVLAFDPCELDDILKRGGQAKEPGCDPDDVPETPVEPITKLGDLWLLGDHRLLCGDATKAEDVEKLMDGQKADLCLTDPPYGMNLNTDWSGVVGSLKSIGRQHQTKGKVYDKVIGDDRPFDPLPLFELYGQFKEVFLFGADYYAENIPNRIDGSWLVWDKRKESQSEAIGSEFELVWSKVKHKRRMLRHDWFGFLSSGNATEARNRVHPTQKPTTLIVDIIEQWGKDYDVVDPYLGSGTTIIAAEQLHHKCYGMEIEPKYVDVAVKRWEIFTGKKAVCYAA